MLRLLDNNDLAPDQVSLREQFFFFHFDNIDIGDDASSYVFLSRTMSVPVTSIEHGWTMALAACGERSRLTPALWYDVVLCGIVWCGV